MIQAHQRYTAKDALKHPWITRKQQSKIPQSFLDEMTTIQFENTLKEKIRLFLFMSIIKKHEDHSIDFDSPRFHSYKRKLESVSDKI